MIIVDKALQARQQAANPIRVGVVGAGFMGQAVTRQIHSLTAGMTVVAVANRTLERAAQAYVGSGVSDVVTVSSKKGLEAAIKRKQPAITDDPLLVCEAEGIDVILEATSTIELAAQVSLSAITHGKHVILVNAELDGSLGPILKVYADRHNVTFSTCDGDQPGVEMNLYRYVNMIGLTPLVCGNIKSLLDHYRTPSTQAEFAATWGQNPVMATSFVDGSKISFEQAIVANATGMSVLKRGMVGVAYEGNVDEPEHLAHYDIDVLRARGGVVDYTLGATPRPGVFVLAAQDEATPAKAVQIRNLALFKMGDGPLYCFYTPFHLCYFEAAMTVGRVALFADACATPLGQPMVDVVATAKRNLQPGEVLDGIGGYCAYGQCENADVSYQDKLLPLAMSQGCLLKQAVKKDTVIRYDDIELPEGRLSDRLRAEQNDTFFASAKASTRVATAD
ncbi:MAG: Gfo/Idh/MocA family oxidoreductase [Deinococcota bacterium]